MSRRFIAVSYDVTDDRRRTKLARALRDFGERVLKSGFELWLEDEEYDRLYRRIEFLMDPAEDQLRIYPLCAKCRRRARVIGGDSPTLLAPSPNTVVI